MARLLGTEADAARGLGTPAVEESIEEGSADEILAAKGATQEVSLVVLGVVGERAGKVRPIGGTAERVAASAKAPLLVVRAAARIEAWLRGEHTLKIVVGDDLTPASEPALRWTAAEPPLDIASEEAADLLVVGTKQRTLFSRVWHGSAPQIVLNRAPSSVACIPVEVVHAPESEMVAPLQRGLVTTDFSPIGNRAVGYAHAIVADEGAVHLLHVEKPDQTSAQQAASDHDTSVERLRNLIPASAPDRDVASHLEVVSDASVSAAITAAVERLDVDVLCMATRGRSGLAEVVLGSVAQAVAERCRRQVILVPPRREES